MTSREMFGADMVSSFREEKLDLVLTPRIDPPADDLAREAIRREPLIATLPEHHPLSSADEIVRLRPNRVRWLARRRSPGAGPRLQAWRPAAIRR